MEKNKEGLQRSVRRLILVIMAGLFISGVTAFPIEGELAIAIQWIEKFKADNLFTQWIEVVYHGVRETNEKYPFVSYGTDWLAFAHLVLAVLFVGPLRDPVKNIWVIEFGIIACLSIFPLALIAGSIRGIPFFWQLIDCSFGVFGGILLWVCYRKIKILQTSHGF
jgi:hypothetical protein